MSQNVIYNVCFDLFDFCPCTCVHLHRHLYFLLHTINIRVSWNCWWNVEQTFMPKTCVFLFERKIYCEWKWHWLLTLVTDMITDIDDWHWLLTLVTDIDYWHWLFFYVYFLLLLEYLVWGECNFHFVWWWWVWDEILFFYFDSSKLFSLIFHSSHIHVTGNGRQEIKRVKYDVCLRSQSLLNAVMRVWCHGCNID